MDVLAAGRAHRPGATAPSRAPRPPPPESPSFPLVCRNSCSQSCVLMSLPTRQRLSEVRYEIRGELARRARELESQGRSLIKLNIGNPGAFGFRAPEHLQQAIAGRIAQTDP